MQLTESQLAVVNAPLEAKIFLSGPAGTGKTTVGVARLDYLLEQGVAADAILVMAPQRTLATPYYDLMADPGRVPGGQVNVTTLGSIAKRAVDLFWPLIADSYGFGNPYGRPTFLTLETAQYFMARVVGPVIEREGYFDSVTVDRNRLYSQVIDNLNKAAVIGFPYMEIAERLKLAWQGDPAQLRMYDDVQTCAHLFRQYCLAHNLLDFSLQIEIFMERLWHLPQVKQYVAGTVQHVIADNMEEDTPAAHQILANLVDGAASALIIVDQQAGYRRFLGADPLSAYDLTGLCDEQVTLADSFVTTSELTAFADYVALSVNLDGADPQVDPRPVLDYQHNFRYHPEMIDGVAEQIIALVNDQGVDPDEIVVLAPFLSDALRFSLTNRLEEAGVPTRSHRPSRSLREEPATRCLLTLAQIAHPHWRLPPTRFDVVYAFMQAFGDLDLGRGQLLVAGVYNPPDLKPFDTIPTATQERITFALGAEYERLREWITAYIEAGDLLELDHFFSKLFGEVLSQPGFGFHDDYDAAAVTANLIDSAQKFRQVIDDSGAPPEGKSGAQEYVEMVAEGIIADQYLREWTVDDADAVLLAPAYTFLMGNRPVDHQFWLNVGGQGWAQRLYQPLTNPYVLTRHWDPEMRGRVWTDEDEYRVNRDALYRLVLGLTRRCRTLIYLGYSDLGEQGYEQRGLLLNAVQGMLRRLGVEGEGA